ncbi:MFS transporter [Levilactobacillus namurensis]|uniref:MFS transporter n=1 Tax=Levilactobacillus namurensis TaxID=380393 RepID=UPI0026F25084|nr:MFS transporter [Levilactobacillus namurensis]
MGKIRIQIGIYALSMLAMASLVVSPIIGLITQAFPGSSISSVQMIISVSNLTGLVAAFVVGKLATSIPKRTLGLFGAAGTFIFGVAPYFFHESVLVLVVFSGLVGVTVGFMTNVIPALIADYFDGNERQAVMGRYVAASSIGAMVMQYLSGALGTINYPTAYLAYIFAGIVFVIALICLPKVDATLQRSQQRTDDQHVSLSQVFNGRVVALMLIGFSFMVVNNVWNNNLSLFLSQEQLGNSNTAGIISMLVQIGGLISGLVMGQLAKLARNYLLGGAFLLTGISFLLLVFSSNLTLVVLAAFIDGFAMSMYFAQGPFMMTLLVPGVLIPMGSALLNAAGGVGGFAQPLLINSLSHALGNTTAKSALLIGAALSFVIAIIVYLTRFQRKCLSNETANGTVANSSAQ